MTVLELYDEIESQLLNVGIASVAPWENQFREEELYRTHSWPAVWIDLQYNPVIYAGTIDYEVTLNLKWEIKSYTVKALEYMDLQNRLVSLFQFNHLGNTIQPFRVRSISAPKHTDSRTTGTIQFISQFRPTFGYSGSYQPTTHNIDTFIVSSSFHSGSTRNDIITINS